MNKKLIAMCCTIPLIGTIPITIKQPILKGDIVHQTQLTSTIKTDERLDNFNKIVEEHEFQKKRENTIKQIDETIKRYDEEQRQLQIKRDKEAKIKRNFSRGGNIRQVDFILSFYTSLDCENGYGAITSCGEKLRDGIVANNVLPIGTEIYLGEYGKYIVKDRGGNNFNSINRLDVFVSRQGSESDYQYKKRVNNMGRKEVVGWILED